MVGNGIRIDFDIAGKWEPRLMVFNWLLHFTHGEEVEDEMPVGDYLSKHDILKNH